MLALDVSGFQGRVVLFGVRFEVVIQLVVGRTWVLRFGGIGWVRDLCLLWGVWQSWMEAGNWRASYRVFRIVRLHLYMQAGAKLGGWVGLGVAGCQGYFGGTWNQPLSYWCAEGIYGTTGSEVFSRRFICVTVCCASVCFEVLDFGYLDQVGLSVR